MKAKELAEILMRTPDYDVLIEPERIAITAVGFSKEQVVKDVTIPCFIYGVSDVVHAVKIISKNTGSNNFYL